MGETFHGALQVSLMGLFDRIYARLPVWGQHAAVSLYGSYWHFLRFGPGYAQYVQDYSSREMFTKIQWDQWQRTRLKTILSACTEHVPYYRDYWDESTRLAALDGDLRSLPLLDKDALRTDPKAFLRDDMHPVHPQIFLTSGSTGTPISSYYTIAELRESLALREVRSACWAGVSFKMPRATFSGRLVEPDPESKGPFHRFNIIEKQVYFSPFHLRPDTAYRYVDALRRHDVHWATGYAVSFYLLARFMIEKKISPPNLRAVITTSEKLTNEMRIIMEQAYGCRIYEEYSTVENAIFASECEHGSLHVSPDVAITEILRPDGSPCAPGEAGEVVVTALSRVYQPLIRFRLGDMATWDDAPCACGRAMPVIKEVLGRMEDIVVGPDGRQMVRFHGVFVNQPHIREGQIVQEALDRIRVKVVTTEGFNGDDKAEITHRIQQRLGPSVSVVVESVPSIPRTSAGKFKAVISLLPK
jgi:phenylacetate-CoA ligase